jgi:hypothetical protein
MMGVETILLPRGSVNALFDPNGVQGPERRGRQITQRKAACP